MAAPGPSAAARRDSKGRATDAIAGLIGTLADSGFGLIAIAGAAVFAAIGLGYMAHFSGAGGATSSAVGRSSRWVQSRRVPRGQNLLCCGVCRSVFRAAEDRCYACGEPASSALPFGALPPDAPLSAPARAPDSVERPVATSPADAAPVAATEAPAEAPTVAVRGSWLLGFAAVTIVAMAAVLALGLVTGSLDAMLPALLVPVVGFGAVVVLGSASDVDLVGRIGRYEALLAVAVIALIPGQMLPPEMRVPIFVLFAGAAFLMGRARSA